MSRNAFENYLHTSGFYIKKGDDRKMTHLLLNGGKLHVPQDKRTEFLKVYSANIAIAKLYVIELKTEIFNFFLDLDFIQQLSIPIDTMKRWKGKRRREKRRKGKRRKGKRSSGS